jgi:hypothetical protein
MATNGSAVSTLAGARVGSDPFVEGFDDHAADDHGADDHGDGHRTVLGRIALIMDAFDCGEQVLSLNDLSHSSKLPKSTVHRLVEQLRALGWLERDHSNV